MKKISKFVLLLLMINIAGSNLYGIPKHMVSPLISYQSFSAPSDPPRSDCCYHIWAAGCNLGWSCALLKYTKSRTRWEAADNTTVDFMIKAVDHVKAAHFTCSKLNPAWPDWKDKQRSMRNLVRTFQSNPNPTIRSQVWRTVQRHIHWSKALKRQVIFDQRPQTYGRKPTCAEKYFLLGLYFGYAQQSLKISDEWRNSRRNDWLRPANDGLSALRRVLDILEKYYLIQSGHCVELKDLRVKSRVYHIRHPQNFKLEIDKRIAKLDKLIFQIHQRMRTKCIHSAGTHNDIQTSDLETENLSDTHYLKPKPRILKINGTITGPGKNNQLYRITTLDTRAFTRGGTIFIKIRLGRGECHGSFDLFPQGAAIPSQGYPRESLQRAYNIQSGSAVTMTHRFRRGEIFKFGATGNWTSRRGSKNSYAVIFEIRSN